MYKLKVEVSDPKVATAGIFNELLLGYVILLFNKLNIFPEFESGTSISRLSSGYNLDERRLRVVVGVASTMGLIQENDGTYFLTPLGHEVDKNRGFFTWAIGGYSQLLESMDVFLARPSASWRPYVRGDYVAIGSDEANQGLMQSIFDRVIDGLACSHVADIGCGNAGRLVGLLNRRPELTGVGIDIDPAAIEAARQNRADHELKNRLDLVCEDAFASIKEPRPEHEKVDAVMSFMMLHDLFNDHELDGRLFHRMKAAFPNVKYFIIADTCRDYRSRTSDTMPIFTMGYELIHALRGIEVFPVEYYERQIAAGGLKLVARHDFGVPNTYLFVLEA